MRRRVNTLLIPLSMIASFSQASCLSGDEVVANSETALMLQTSYIKRTASPWRTDGESSYTPTNAFQDAGIKFSSKCAVIENRLDIDFSLSGLAYYAWHSSGSFEEDQQRSRLLLNRLQLNYTLSDHLRLEAGKLTTTPGLFFLKSPAALMNNYYAGFKSTRLYDPAMRSSYSESSWGARLVDNHRDYSLSLTVAPQLATINQRYETSSRWSAKRRGNAQARYLLSYTDYRLANHTPALSLLLGDTRSLALSDSFSYTPALTFNGEMALHNAQQWRHFSPERAAEVVDYQFPSSLYRADRNAGVEVALGAQYTTRDFAVLGLEYYFQSEGYSGSEWQQQAQFSRYLNRASQPAVLDQISDAYKYLMGAEMGNIANRGQLQGKHYLSAYGSLRSKQGATLQPYITMNMRDNSALLGLHVSTPVAAFDDSLNVYAGGWAGLGKQDTEFAFFGKTVGFYLGLNYFL
ncbi:hypothetical protein PU683_16365 [Kosakonia cowanii]|uniref:hypothetical protein n=1 Tax=Kosakonia cowanii TaxID=208223 RepID=UPI0023F7BEF5|nr:hypothetical protein [Kosakonia cowanii]MDF7761095.1 hypothetical protein [Kosakonia cowanii]